MYHLSCWNILRSKYISCKVCPAGKIIEDDEEDPSLHQNISSCVNCAAGRFLEDNTDNPEAHDDADVDCVECPGGYYQTGAGSSACVLCPLGTANSNTKQTALSDCVNCAVGRYADQRGQLSCKVCSPGTYQDDAGKYYCITCGAGKVLTASATDPGDHDEQSDCTNCPSGRRLPDAGNTNDGEFVVKTSGRCGDQSYQYMASKEQCLTAMLHLGLSAGTNVHTSYSGGGTLRIDVSSKEMLCTTILQLAQHFAVPHSNAYVEPSRATRMTKIMTVKCARKGLGKIGQAKLAVLRV